MVALAVLLLSMGCMASGYQNASTWCAFTKAQTGRRQITAFMIVSYVINLGWYIIFIGSALPTVFFFMLDNGVCTNDQYTSSTCLDLRQFGLAPQSLPAIVNSTIICDTDLQDICSSSLLSYFFLTLLGSIIVLLGMNHYMMCLAGNYNWLRVRKRRQKLMAGQINRRSGTYDLTASPYTMSSTDRQESQDSNAHLRRANLNIGSSSEVLASSSEASIPTVAAKVSTSSSWNDPSSTSTSGYSSKIYNQTYGFDDAGFGGQTVPNARVTFADTTKPVSFQEPSETKITVSSSKKPTATTTPTTSSSTRSWKTNQNNLSTDRQYTDRASRYDHYNPAFDENYWDQQQYTTTSTDDAPDDNYYSRGNRYSNPLTSQSNGSAGGGGVGGDYDQGNQNQGYYNYDYDAADSGGGGRGYEMDPMSHYGQDNTQAARDDRTSVGNKFYEYQL